MGTYIHQTARQLDISHTGNDCWSSVVGGTTEEKAQDALNSFHTKKASRLIWLPLTSRLTSIQSITSSKQAYISAISRSSVTISGPPSTLKQLSDPAYTFGTSSCLVPIGGPYHADHLHYQARLQQFLPTSEPHMSPLDGYHLLLPIISSSTGSLFDPNLSILDLLSLVIYDIISHPLQLEKVLNQCVNVTKEISAHRCAILSFGPSSAGGSLLATLKRETTVDVTLNQPSKHSPVIRSCNERIGRSRKPKIAIIGMAGRFPNAADHEKFWKLLESGLDVHRKVAAPLSQHR